MQKENLKQKTLFIKGMHCASCEILIEKELLKIPGVEYADVSLNSNSANIYFQPGTKIKIKKLNSKLKKLNYSVSEEKEKVKTKPKLFKSLTIAVLVLVLFYLFEQLQLGKYVSVDSTASLVTIFLLGLIASVSSCAALIGGILLSLSKHWQKNAVESHTAFHASRLLSFIVLGGLLGLLGSVIKFNGIFLTALLVIAVSVVMVILALQMLEFKFAQKIRLALPKSVSAKVAASSSKGSSAYIVGALTFFLPCGFTLIAQGLALASGSFVAGAIIMAVFALGTLPALLVISATSVSFGKKPHLSVVFNQVVGIVLIFFALYNINSQFNVLGLPSLSDLRTSSAATIEVESDAEYEAMGEEQVINLVATDFDYILKGESEFEAGKQTKLVVDNKDAYGCAVALTVFGLMDDYVLLEKGENIIDLGEPKAGSYKITCSMGMVTPITVKFT
ncbi:hypothetical protein GF340_04270 [Candidatus Peregrinibacteria bacterium]|nr:hypothetical protein [Candidatus Peregrinibacteria bacterium]